jgi:hypothetical protein
VIRERTYTNLLIGLVFSVLIHAYLVVWGPGFSVPTPVLSSPTVEVQLREWPSPVHTSPSVEAAKTEEAPPALPIPVPSAKPVLPPNAQALQEAVQIAQSPLLSNRVEVRLPERTLILPTLEAQHDPIQLAEGVRDALHDGRDEPRLSDLARLSELPAPERQGAEGRPLPSLPTLAPPTTRESIAAGPRPLRCHPLGLPRSFRGPHLTDR